MHILSPTSTTCTKNLIVGRWLNFLQVWSKIGPRLSTFMKDSTRRKVDSVSFAKVYTSA